MYEYHHRLRNVSPQQIMTPWTGIPLPCGHTLKNPSNWQRGLAPQDIKCTVPVLKQCVRRGHYIRVPCATVMSEFTCLELVWGVLPPPCHPPGGSDEFSTRQCYEVDDEGRYNRCSHMITLDAKCKAGEHALQAPCHVVAKAKGLRPEEMKGLPLPHCEEPFDFKCKRGVHNQSLPCHQRDRKNCYDCNVQLTTRLEECGHEVVFPCAQKKKVVCRQCNQSQLPRPTLPTPPTPASAVGQTETSSGSIPSSSIQRLRSTGDDDEVLAPVSSERDVGEKEWSSSSSLLIGNPNEVDKKAVSRTPMDVLSTANNASRYNPAPCKTGRLQLPCGHTLENPSQWQLRTGLCPVIVSKECSRGHATRVTCNTDMSHFKCMTVIQGAPSPPSCPHGGGTIVQRECHEVDLTLGHYLCPIMVEINAMCGAGDHALKAPCHLAAKLEGLTSDEEREAIYKFPPCQEPFQFKCKRGLHNRSVPCHERSQTEAYVCYVHVKQAMCRHVASFPCSQTKDSCQKCPHRPPPRRPHRTPLLLPVVASPAVVQSGASGSMPIQSVNTTTGDDDEDLAPAAPSTSFYPSAPSVESILVEIWAFVAMDDREYVDYKHYLSRSIPKLLPPTSITGLDGERQDLVVRKLLDRLVVEANDEDVRKIRVLMRVVKTASVLNYTISQWKYLLEPGGDRRMVAMESMTKIVHSVLEVNGIREKELRGICNSICRQICGCYVEWAAVVKSKMTLPTDNDSNNGVMYKLIMELSESFLQSVCQNPLHNDVEFCNELVKGLSHPEVKRAVMWALLGILATLKDPSRALEVGKCCGDVISELLDDLNIPTHRCTQRVAGIVEDDEFFAWKTVLKSVFPRPSVMFEINYRIKNPKARAWFRGLELDHPNRKEFGDFYPVSPEPDEGLMALDVLKVEDPSTSITTVKSENPSVSPPSQCAIGSGVSSSGNNLMYKRSSAKTHGNRDDKHKKTKI